MALTRALAVDNEQITNTEVIVTSALASTVTAILPVVGDGTGVTVADDFGVTVWANSTGAVMLKDNYGHLVGVVNPGESKLFSAVSFGLNNLGNRWYSQDNNERISLKASTEEVAAAASAALAFTANTPAAIVTRGNVNRYLKVTLSDGTVGYIPVWV